MKKKPTFQAGKPIHISYRVVVATEQDNLRFENKKCRSFNHNTFRKTTSILLSKYIQVSKILGVPTQLQKISEHLQEKHNSSICKTRRKTIWQKCDLQIYTSDTAPLLQTRSANSPSLGSS